MAFLDLAAWGVMGVSVQGLAQGLRQKPLNYKPMGYVLSGAAFVGLGFILDNVRQAQNAFINERVSLLARERLERGVEFSRE